MKFSNKRKKYVLSLFSAVMVLAMLVPSISCKPETLTTTVTITEKSNVTSTVVSNVTNTVTNVETITSTVTSTFTPTQTSTSQTTPSTTQTTPTTTQTTPTTSTTLTYTTGTTSVVWSADGVITEGEYAQMQQMDANYYMYWNIDEEYVYFGIRVKTSGYVQIGISTSAVLNSDVVRGWVKNGEVTVYDGSVTSPVEVPSDTELGGTNDLLDSGMTESDGYTTMEFKRALKTNDSYDLEFKYGSYTNITWSYGSNDSPSYYNDDPVGVLFIKL
jgi:hypothetical protein